MRLQACIGLVLLPWVGAAGLTGLKCSLVNKAVTALQEQRQATSFCSSYLKLSTVYQTTTITSTSSVTATATALSTSTSTTPAISTVTTFTTPVVTATTQVIDTISSGTTVDNTITNTATSTTTITSIVATSTIFGTTSTVTSTSTVGTQTTTTSTSTTTTNLSYCTRPAFNKKRQLGYGKSIPTPKCFSSYTQASVISSACSCLSIPKPTSTRTSTAITTKTITSTKTNTSNQVVTSTSTTTSIRTGNPSTVTVTITSTTTQITTGFRTETATASTVATSTFSSTATISIATTTTITTIVTTTSTSTATATATRYSNFALMASSNNQYGRIQDSVGGSGQGVYFAESNLASAATFSFAGNQLFFQNQYVQSYAAASGDYYIVVERPYAQFGYPTQCTLNNPTFSGDGCTMDCRIPGNFYPAASGNNVQNYNGAWGLQGSTDSFAVYAVGQT